MNAPVIKRALGSAWGELHPLVRRHYDVRPGTEQRVTMRGTMDEVYHSTAAKPFLLLGRIFGALVPYRGRNVPVEVHNWGRIENTQDVFWHRTFSFPDRRPFVFSSRMVHIAGDEIVEYVRFGMGVRMRMSVRDGALIFTGIGYRWNLGPFTLYLPSWLILGHAVIEERALSDDEFLVDFKMEHPLLGRTFAYSGRFRITGTGAEESR